MYAIFDLHTFASIVHGIVEREFFIKLSNFTAVKNKKAQPITKSKLGFLLHLLLI